MPKVKVNDIMMNYEQQGSGDELDPSSDTDVEQLWIKESQRRYEAYLKGELKSVSGEDVMSRARRRLK